MELSRRQVQATRPPAQTGDNAGYGKDCLGAIRERSKGKACTTLFSRFASQPVPAFGSAFQSLSDSSHTCTICSHLSPHIACRSVTRVQTAARWATAADS
jgi:hypothetical protein